MAKKITGGCLCGATRYEISGEPGFSIRCYCRDCQQISGGGHLPQFAAERASTEVSGSLKIHKWKAESGNDLTLGFCGDCGSPLYKTSPLMPDSLFILAGSLDQPAEFTPKQDVFTDSRQPWDDS